MKKINEKESVKEHSHIQIWRHNEWGRSFYMCSNIDNYSSGSNLIWGILT